MYMILEYIPGQMLSDKLEITNYNNNQGTAIGEGLACYYMQQVLMALAHCHAYKVIHCDIKPQNIMVTESNEVKLIDFNLSKIQLDSKVSFKDHCGSPQYMAPEVINSQYGMMADIWSAGIVFYVMVMGTTPFKSATEDKKELKNKICTEEIDFTLNIYDHVSSECKDLLTGLL